MIPLFTPAFLNLGGSEVFLIVMVIIMLFGAKSIPELAKGLGKGIREMKDAMGGVESEIKREINIIEREAMGKPDHTLPEKREEPKANNPENSGSTPTT